MAQVITVFMTGNTPEEATEGFVWDEQDQAAEYARENGEKYVYEIKKHVYAEDLTVVNDLDAAGDPFTLTVEM